MLEIHNALILSPRSGIVSSGLLMISDEFSVWNIYFIAISIKNAIFYVIKFICVSSERTFSKPGRK